MADDECVSRARAFRTRTRLKPKHLLAVLAVMTTALPKFYAGEAKVSLVGTRATLTLLTDVSSEFPATSPFEARLDDPIRIDGHTLMVLFR